MANKSNIEYLREMLIGNDVANEWLDSIEKELDNEKDEVRRLELELNDLENQYSAEKSYWGEHTIKTHQGDIRWDADNLQHIAIMEALGHKINYKSALEIESAINAL